MARLGVLNQEPDESVYNLYFNDLDNSVLSAAMISNSGRCHRTFLEGMKTGNFQQRVNVFGALAVPPDHFMTYLNGLAMVKNSAQSYDIFDLRNYSLIYSITDLDYVEDVRLVPEMVLICRQVVRNEITLIIRNSRDGVDIQEFLLPSDDIFQPCLVKEKLLYNDQLGNSNLLDMRTGRVKRLTDKLKEATFACLKNNLLISWEAGSETGSISVTNIWTGHLMAKITNDDWVKSGPEPSYMYYDEEKEELYTGTLDGAFQLWGS